MSGQRLGIHGRDHRPGGADPMPDYRQWAELGLDTATLGSGSAAKPVWLEDGFYTSDARIYAFIDSGSAPGIEISMEGMYACYGVSTLGKVGSDLSSSTIEMHMVFVDGGSEAFTGDDLEFGDWLQRGLYDGANTIWLPHLLAFGNLQADDAPGTLTLELLQTTGGDLSSSPRIFVVRLGDANAGEITFPVAV